MIIEAKAFLRIKQPKNEQTETKNVPGICRGVLAKAIFSNRLRNSLLVLQSSWLQWSLKENPTSIAVFRVLMNPSRSTLDNTRFYITASSGVGSQLQSFLFPFNWLGTFSFKDKHLLFYIICSQQIHSEHKEQVLLLTHAAAKRLLQYISPLRRLLLIFSMFYKVQHPPPSLPFLNI